MFVVDTNVLVHAANADSQHHALCHRLVAAWREGPEAWFVTWGILYEFLRVTTHPRVFRKPWSVVRAWSFVSALLQAPGLSVLRATDRHADVAERTFTELPHLGGNLVHDAHTAILMREHGVRAIYTRDADFHRFPFLQPIDPVRPELREPAARPRSAAARKGRQKGR
jgi:toxin-antitoxin system PIN domain toxin